MSRSVPAMTAAVICLLATSPSGHGQEARRYIEPRTATDAKLPPFSGAVRVGNTLYLSGDIGVDANNRVPDTAEGEARLLLESIQGTLKEAGFTMDDLVFVQVFCSDVKHYDAFKERIPRARLHRRRHTALQREVRDAGDCGETVGIGAGLSADGVSWRSRVTFATPCPARFVELLVVM
jgi:enamine deaminase RidA (YjgF/YER057c/UK114 family)